MAGKILLAGNSGQQIPHRAAARFGMTKVLVRSQTKTRVKIKSKSKEAGGGARSTCRGGIG